MGNIEREEQLRKIRQEMLEEAKQKLYGEAGVKNLVSGIILVFVALLFMAIGYIYFFGQILSLPQGTKAVLTDVGFFTSMMVIFWLIILFIGILGGFEIGRYVQTEFTKRRRQKQIPPSPPPPPT